MSTGIKIIKKSYKQGSLSSASASDAGSTAQASTLTSNSNSPSNSPSPSPSPTPTLYTEVINTNSKEDTSSDTVMSLTAAQKDDLIEKMETRKHKLKLAYRDAHDPDIKRQYGEVCELLAKVKECDAVDKMQNNITDSSKLTQEFRRKYKQLAVSDFNRIIDLTGSKEGRKPDIATETWLKGRTVVFKDKVYRPPPEDKLDKFKQKMCLKAMPSEIKKTIDKTVQGNLEAVEAHRRPDTIKYKHYNPLDFNGLSTY